MKPLKKVLLLVTFAFFALFAITISPATHKLDQNDLYWLALNIYYEAGNQPAIGKMAVGIVTINRLKNPLYANTIEGVVKERKQFSWYNSRKVVIPKMSKEWEESILIAEYILKLPYDHAIMDMFKNATHFHATYVAPSWRNSMIKVAQIGDHIFYRMKEKK